MHLDLFLSNPYTAFLYLIWSHKMKSLMKKALLSKSVKFWETWWGLTDLYWNKEWKNDIFILICAHMAQNPLFWGACKMCLMGDIQVHSKYRWCHWVHLTMCCIRIFIYPFLRSLIFPKIIILTFCISSKMWEVKNTNHLERV